MQWRTSRKLVAYDRALAAMQRRVERRAKGRCGDLIWFLEHPCVYTRGALSQESDLLLPDRFPVFNTSRGGKYTYHGPGQCIIYIMVKLPSDFNIRHFVQTMETWVHASLAKLGVHSFSDASRPGIWVAVGPEGSAKKVGSLGFRFRKSVSYHGISVNLSPDLEHFSGIRPCGIEPNEVTSLQEMGVGISMPQLHKLLKSAFYEVGVPSILNLEE